MEKERPVTKEIARQPQSPVAGVPADEGEIADQPVNGALAPAVEAVEQQRRVATLGYAAW